ncbi:MAG TPA: hypothetical protein VHD14_08425 [Pseudolabrys sp.]|nr:hypothetical protein [Pseudolabrys sp.]
MHATRTLQIVVLAAAALSLPAPLRAQQNVQGAPSAHGVDQNQESTPVQRRACEPDVYRWCKWYIPSHSGITYCLHQNIDRLSPACRAVMEGRLR